MLLSFSDFVVGVRLVWAARFWLLAFWFAFGMGCVVVMASQFSGRQPATVALDVGLSVIRIGIPIIAALMIQEILSKEIERKYYFYSLSYPRPRFQLLLGRFGAVYALSLGFLAVLSLILTGLVFYIDQGYEQAAPVALNGYLVLTLVYMALDFFVIVAIAVLLAVIASTPGFVLLGAIGFMLVARSYSSIIILLKSRVQVVENPEAYSQTLGMIRYILPDLGALDIRPIVLYSENAFLPQEWLGLVLSTFFYGTAVLLLAIWIFNRRRFS